MSEHRLAVTTHTTELRQIAEMNAALQGGRHTVTAGSLGLAERVPGEMVLQSLSPVGPPDYPYVYGVFAGPGSERAAVARELHTDHLRGICDQLALRGHIWGV